MKSFKKKFNQKFINIPRTSNFIGLNIINETEDDIEYDDINELFEQLEQCNTETLELNIFGSHILKLLLGNKINSSMLALVKNIYILRLEFTDSLIFIETKVPYNHQLHQT